MNRAIAAFFSVLLLFASVARAEEVRLLVSIAANIGDPNDTPLRYAHEDAERFRRLMVELGALSPDRAYLVVNQPAQMVRQRLAEVSGRVAELRAAGRDVVLMIYASSHASGGVLHLMGTHLPLEELREFAANSGARLRVLIVDACDSGAIARRKGGARGPEFEVKLEKLPLRGQVIITSSGPAQASEEWEELRGSLFTHHLLTGLRGDADSEGDGRVTLSEAYAYAYRRTVATAARDGQHPSYDWDLSGTGELVFTEPRRAQSALLFPAASQGSWVISSVPRSTVVAEVEKIAGRPLRLAVPSGRYVVRKRQGRSAGLLEVELPYGGEKEIREKDLEWRDYTEVALKGGRLELKPWSVFLLGAAQSAPIAGTPMRFQPGLGLRRTEGEWWFGATMLGHEVSYRAVDLTTRERSASLGLNAGYRWLSWPVIPHAGVGVELIGLEQRFVRDREEDIQRVLGRGPLATARALGLALGPVLGLEVPLPGPAFALLQGRVGVRFLSASGQDFARLDAQAFLAAGFRF